MNNRLFIGVLVLLLVCVSAHATTDSRRLRRASVSSSCHSTNVVNRTQVDSLKCSLERRFGRTLHSQSSVRAKALELIEQPTLSGDPARIAVGANDVTAWSRRGAESTSYAVYERDASLMVAGTSLIDVNLPMDEPFEWSLSDTFTFQDATISKLYISRSGFVSTMYPPGLGDNLSNYSLPVDSYDGVLAPFWSNFQDVHAVKYGVKSVDKHKILVVRWIDLSGTGNVSAGGTQLEINTTNSAFYFYLQDVSLTSGSATSGLSTVNPFAGVSPAGFRYMTGTSDVLPIGEPYAYEISERVDYGPTPDVTLSSHTYTFSTCDQVGPVGPTQNHCTTAYSGTNLAGRVDVVEGTQIVEIEQGGLYKISAYGARGGGLLGLGAGFGAKVETSYFLERGDHVWVIVGQRPVDAECEAGGSGGGGATAVALLTDTKIGGAAYVAQLGRFAKPIVVAGGGGGAIDNFHTVECKSDPDSSPTQNGRGACGNVHTRTTTTGGPTGGGGWLLAGGGQGATCDPPRGLTQMASVPSCTVRDGAGRGGFGGGGNPGERGGGGGGGWGGSFDGLGGSSSSFTEGGQGGCSFASDSSRSRFYTGDNTDNGWVELTLVVSPTAVPTPVPSLPSTMPADYLFTPCGKLGGTGPTQIDCDIAYYETSLSGKVSIARQSPGYQRFAIETSGAYAIKACGARGGGYTELFLGGAGSCVSFSVNLKVGDKLIIVVGQAGSSLSSMNESGGGGGFSVVSLVWGSGVYLSAADETVLPLAVAGGGGGYVGCTGTLCPVANLNRSNGKGLCGRDDVRTLSGSYVAGGAGLLVHPKKPTDISCNNGSLPQPFASNSSVTVECTTGDSNLGGFGGGGSGGISTKQGGGGGGGLGGGGVGGNAADEMDGQGGCSDLNSEVGDPVVAPGVNNNVGYVAITLTSPLTSSTTTFPPTPAPSLSTFIHDPSYVESISGDPIPSDYLSLYYDNVTIAYGLPDSSAFPQFLAAAPALLLFSTESGGYSVTNERTDEFNGYPSYQLSVTMSRPVFIVVHSVVISSSSPIGDYPSLASDLQIQQVNPISGLLGPAMSITWAKDSPYQCNLVSATADQFLCFNGTHVEGYDIDTSDSILSRGFTIPIEYVRLQRDCSSRCLGGTFAFDGFTFQFPWNAEMPSNDQLVIFDADDGTYIRTETSDNDATFSAVLFDWSIGRYVAYAPGGSRELDSDEYYRSSSGAGVNVTYSILSRIHTSAAPTMTDTEPATTVTTREPYGPLPQPTPDGLFSCDLFEDFESGFGTTWESEPRWGIGTRGYSSNWDVVARGRDFSEHSAQVTLTANTVEQSSALVTRYAVPLIRGSKPVLSFWTRYDLEVDNDGRPKCVQGAGVYVASIVRISQRRNQLT